MSLLRNLNLQNINLDRRQKLRIVPNELVFLQLERDDGGTVLDVSEGGLGFETFAPVNPNGPVHFWFSLNLRDRIEAWGEVVWTNATKKCGGLRFLRLSEEARAQIRRWMTEFSRRQAVDEESARRPGPESRPDRFGRGKLDAVAAFVSKARPQHSTLFSAVEGSASADMPASIFEAPAVTNPGSTDVFSGSNQQKASSPSRVLNPQLATATPPARSHTMEPAKPAAASAPPAVQQHSSEIASKSQPSRTPEQLWASVQAGNSKAALELAELYIQGNGVPQNCTQARVLLMVASEKRNAGAIKRLQELDKAGCPGE